MHAYVIKFFFNILYSSRVQSPLACLEVIERDSGEISLSLSPTTCKLSKYSSVSRVSTIPYHFTCTTFDDVEMGHFYLSCVQD
jgi:hypothetical protein